MTGVIVNNPVFNSSGATVTFFPIGPTATYLDVDLEIDIPGDPLIIDLETLGIEPGDVVILEGVGAFSFTQDGPEFGQNASFVLSATNVVLDPGTNNRVPGAIDLPVDFEIETERFAFDFSPISNDIPEDARLTFSQPAGDEEAPNTFIVPAGARFLIAGVNDLGVGDNEDRNNDLGLQIAGLDPAGLILADNNDNNSFDGTGEITATDGDDVIFAFNGTDEIIGSLGADTIYGGTGFDIVRYGLDENSPPINVDLSDDLPESGGLAEGDILIGVEEVTGTDGNDIFKFGGDFG
ncbi:MAG: hypothetical protein AAF675_03725 [Pseudomonadota bacterium]